MSFNALLLLNWERLKKENSHLQNLNGTWPKYLADRAIQKTEREFEK